MRRFIARFIQNRSGATALEYGLIISLIFLVIVTSVTAFGNATTGLFNGAMNAIRTAMGG